MIFMLKSACPKTHTGDGYRKEDEDYFPWGSGMSLVSQWFQFDSLFWLLEMNSQSVHFTSSRTSHTIWPTDNFYQIAIQYLFFNPYHWFKHHYWICQFNTQYTMRWQFALIFEDMLPFLSGFQVHLWISEWKYMLCYYYKLKLSLTLCQFVLKCLFLVFPLYK